MNKLIKTKIFQTSKKKQEKLKEQSVNNQEKEPKIITSNFPIWFRFHVNNGSYFAFMTDEVILSPWWVINKKSYLQGYYKNAQDSDDMSHFDGFEIGQHFKSLFKLKLIWPLKHIF